MNKTKLESIFWEMLSYECEACKHEAFDVPGGEVYYCEQCDSDSIVPEWNYENMECLLCNNFLEIEEEAYTVKNGNFEDIVCCNCYDQL